VILVLVSVPGLGVKNIPVVPFSMTYPFESDNVMENELVAIVFVGLVTLVRSKYMFTNGSR
jgi:hypothetical protein